MLCFLQEKLPRAKITARRLAAESRERLEVLKRTSLLTEYEGMLKEQRRLHDEKRRAQELVNKQRLRVDQMERAVGEYRSRWRRACIERDHTIDDELGALQTSMMTALHGAEAALEEANALSSSPRAAATASGVAALGSQLRGLQAESSRLAWSALSDAFDSARARLVEWGDARLAADALRQAVSSLATREQWRREEEERLRVAEDSKAAPPRSVELRNAEAGYALESHFCAKIEEAAAVALSALIAALAEPGGGTDPAAKDLVALFETWSTQLKSTCTSLEALEKEAVGLVDSMNAAARVRQKEREAERKRREEELRRQHEEEERRRKDDEARKARLADLSKGTVAYMMKDLVEPKLSASSPYEGSELTKRQGKVPLNDSVQSSWDECEGSWWRPEEMWILSPDPPLFAKEPHPNAMRQGAIGKCVVHQPASGRVGRSTYTLPFTSRFVLTSRFLFSRPRPRSCWFITAMSTAAQQPSMITSAFLELAESPPTSYPVRRLKLKQHTNKSAGLFAVRFYKDATWHAVVVDDYIPCRGSRGYDHARCFMVNPNVSWSKPWDKELWAIAMEKAFAQVSVELGFDRVTALCAALSADASATLRISHSPPSRQFFGQGSYQNLVGGWSDDGLTFITGGAAMPSINSSPSKQTSLGRSHFSTGRLAQSSDGPIDADAAYDRLEAFARCRINNSKAVPRFFLTCSTRANTHGDSVKVMGLPQNHGQQRRVFKPTRPHPGIPATAGVARGAACAVRVRVTHTHAHIFID